MLLSRAVIAAEIVKQLEPLFVRHIPPARRDEARRQVFDILDADGPAGQDERFDAAVTYLHSIEAQEPLQ